MNLTVRSLICMLVLLLASCDSRSERHIVVQPAEPAAPTPEPKPAAPMAPVEQVPGLNETPLITAGAAPPAAVPSENDEMVEVLRAKLVELHGPLDMTARSVLRIGDWTWLEGQPHAPGSRSESLDVVSALMHEVDGKWQLVTMACGEDSEACNESWKHFAKDHPDAPAAIFPNATPRTKRLEAMLTAQFGGTHLTRSIADLARKLQLAPGEKFKIEEIARDASSSHHVVALLDREPLHTHDTHDLLVIVLEGEGEMLIGDHTRSIGEHSIAYVPRHTVHSMHNTTQKPLIGYAVFTPPFDGKDRVLVAKP